MPPRQPSNGTLSRYGLTQEDYWALWAEQGEACGFCHADAHATYVIDHEHVRGFDSMPAEVRRQYVRGIVGAHENHRLLGRWVSIESALNLIRYLYRYERRRFPC